MTQKFHFKYFISSFHKSLGGSHGNQLFTDEEHLLSHSGNLYEAENFTKLDSFCVDIMQPLFSCWLFLIGFVKKITLLDWERSCTREILSH